MKKTIALTALTAALLAAPACETSTSGGGVSQSTHKNESRYIGNWRMQSGDLLMMKDAPGDAFMIEHAAPGGNKRYEAFAVEIGGKTMWEVSLYKPGSESGVPVYNYYLVEGGGDSVTAMPMRSEWLEKTVKEMGAGSFKSTGDLLPGTGGAVVKDQDVMEKILQKAATDPNAFGQPETLTRVKSK